MPPAEPLPPRSFGSPACAALAAPAPAGDAGPSVDLTSRNPFDAPSFTRYWVASITAGVGLGIQTVTVPLYLRDRVEPDERAAVIAAALVVQNLPGALLALVGGAVADRVARWRILVRTYLLVGAVSLVYVGLASDPTSAIWPVFPLAALVGSAAAFTNPARQSLVPQLVGPGQLQNGVIFANMGTMAALQFLGPSVAGLGIDGLGLAAAFGLQALLLLLAAALFSNVRTPVTGSGSERVLESLRSGLRYVAPRPAQASLLLLGTTVGVFFIGPFTVTIPILVPDWFGAADKWVGLLFGCFGAGVLVGSIALMWLPERRRGRSVILANLAGGLLLCALSQSRSLPLSASLLFVWGTAAAVFMNYVVVLLQTHTEPAMMGRVMSMYSLAFFGSMPLGYAQAGWVTTRFGVEATLLSSGLASAAIGLLCLLGLRSVRELD